MVCVNDMGAEPPPSPSFPNSDPNIHHGTFYTLIFVGCKLAGGYTSSSRNDCVKVVDIKPKNSCSPEYGNPIQPLTGSKTQAQDLGINIGNIAGAIRYDSKAFLPYVAGTPTADGTPAPLAFNDIGSYWRTNFNKYIELVKNDTTVVGITYLDETGNPLFFTSSDGSVFSNTTTNLKVVPHPNGDGYIVIAEDGGQDVFSLSTMYRGRHPIKTSVSPTGRQLSFVYSAIITTNAPELGLLTNIQDDAGHFVSIAYEQMSGSPSRVTSLSNSDGLLASLSYVGSRLDRLTWADGKFRQFLYESSILPWALTGIVDENNDRHSTYSYDEQGYATGTMLNAGPGPEAQVNKYVATYTSKPVPTVSESYDAASNTLFRTHGWTVPEGVSVLLPSGQTTNLASANVGGTNVLVGQSQPAGSGCSASNSNTAYDARGNTMFKDDFDGTRACYSYDEADHVIAKIEGLSASTACPSPDGMTLPAGARMFRRQWAHNQTVKSSAPGLIRTIVYHGQPDPLNGNAIASCAPSNALMPDGNPIIVPCKIVEQATLDPSGALGFSASLDLTVAARTFSYTYDQVGNVLTVQNPEGFVTTSSYVANMLLQTTNAKGQAAQITARDGAGRVLSYTTPDGLTTNVVYTPRGLTNSITVSAPNGPTRTSTYTYDGVGQLLTATAPDGQTSTFTYDSAHRLIASTDARGNSMHFTLDAKGNRVFDQLKSSSGAVHETVNRIFDALNRVQQVQKQ